MKTFEKSIDVSVPASVAYALFTEYERFPSFMDGVKSVQRVSHDELEWRASVGGKAERWTARITEESPNQRVAWRSVAGARNAGSVTFEPLGPERCRVNLRIEYDPEGPVENIGAILGVVDGRLAADLKRFKELAEGDIATGDEEARPGRVDKVVPTDLMDGGQRRDQKLEEHDQKPRES